MTTNCRKLREAMTAIEAGLNFLEAAQNALAAGNADLDQERHFGLDLNTANGQLIADFHDCSVDIEARIRNARTLLLRAPPEIARAAIDRLDTATLIPA